MQPKNVSCRLRDFYLYGIFPTGKIFLLGFQADLKSYNVFSNTRISSKFFKVKNFSILIFIIQY